MSTVYDEPPLGELNSLQFGLLSDEAIESLAVMEVKSSQCTSNRDALYDLRMGSTDRIHPCHTCLETYDKCQGHFGFFRLNTEVILFPSHVLQFLRCLCLVCGRLLANEGSLIMAECRSFASAFLYASKLSRCMHCDEPHPSEVKYVENKFRAFYKHKKEDADFLLDPLLIQTIFKKPTVEESAHDMRLLHLDPAMCLPRFLVHSLFLVVPNQSRMRIHTDVVTDSDLTLIYKQMIEKSKALLTEKDPDKRKMLIECLQMRAVTFIDDKKVKQGMKKDFFKVFESLTSFFNPSGNKEKGYIRLKIQGRRTNYNARSVITPDPTLKMTQLRIPVSIARAVTKPVHVTPYNIKTLQSVIDEQCNKRSRKKSNFYIQSVSRDGKMYVTKSLDQTLIPGDAVENDCIIRYGKKLPKPFFHQTLVVGDIVHRSLKEGDLVILNRQPTLHRASMQAMEILFHYGDVKTFSFALCVCHAFNSDFDGDEMNIFVPQSLEAEAELAVLLGAGTIFNSLQSSKSEFPMIQDTILGAYNMSKQKIQREDAMQLYMAMVTIEPNIHPFTSVFTEDVMPATILIGACIPKNFHYNYNGVVIEKGRVHPSSVFTSVHLGKTHFSLQRLISFEYSTKEAILFENAMQALCVEFCRMFPVTIGINDCFSLDTKDEEDITLAELAGIPKENQSDSTLDNIMMSFKNRCEVKLDKLKRQFPNKYRTHFDMFIESGSKGDRFNVNQMQIALGQQHKMFGQKSVDGGRRSSIHFPRQLSNLKQILQTKGFVFNSFFGAPTKGKPYTGLTPQEVMVHGETGREGVVSRAVMTAQKGYTARRIIKAMENVQVEEDGSVRDNRKNILQFTFGGNVGYALDKVTYNKKDNVYEPVNLERLVKTINLEYDYLNPEPLDGVQELVETLVPLPISIDGPLANVLVEKERRYLTRVLEKIDVANPQAFKEKVIHYYARARIPAGDPVGFNVGNSVGEVNTQMCLNLFHKSGSNQISEDDAHQTIEQLIEMPKSHVSAVYTIHFHKTFCTLTEVRDALGVDNGVPMAQILFRDVISECIKTGNVIHLVMNREACFVHRISPATLACGLVSTGHVTSIDMVEVDLSPERDVLRYCATILPNLDLLVAGFKGLVRWDILKHETGGFFAMATGNISFSNLYAYILGHPLVDAKRTKCNHPTIVYCTLGLFESRRLLAAEFAYSLKSIFPANSLMLVDVMTRKGKPMNFTRYTMRIAGEGPTSHMSFEEPTRTIMEATRNTTKDPLTSISGCVMFSKRVPVGTGHVHLIDKPPQSNPEEEFEFLNISYV